MIPIMVTAIVPVSYAQFQALRNGQRSQTFGMKQLSSEGADPLAPF